MAWSGCWDPGLAGKSFDLVVMERGRANPGCGLWLVLIPWDDVLISISRSRSINGGPAWQSWWKWPRKEENCVQDQHIFFYKHIRYVVEGFKKDHSQLFRNILLFLVRNLASTQYVSITCPQEMAFTLAHIVDTASSNIFCHQLITPKEYFKIFKIFHHALTWRCL